MPFSLLSAQLMYHHLEETSLLPAVNPGLGTRSVLSCSLPALGVPLPQPVTLDCSLLLT